VLLLLIIVATTQVVEISVAAAEKRRLLLEVQGCGWCFWWEGKEVWPMAEMEEIPLLLLVWACSWLLELVQDTSELACVLVLTDKMGGATGWGCWLELLWGELLDEAAGWSCCHGGVERWSNVGWNVEELDMVEKNFSWPGRAHAIAVGELLQWRS